jgi:hypothetical protein
MNKINSATNELHSFEASFVSRYANEISICADTLREQGLRYTFFETLGNSINKIHGTYVGDPLCASLIVYCNTVYITLSILGMSFIKRNWDLFYFVSIQDFTNFYCKK